MADSSQVESTFANHEPPKSDAGTVSLVVLRKGGGEHECPDRCEVTTEDGLVGDRWTAEKDPERDGQVTLMMRQAAEAVAGGKPLHLPGDNFLVDIDLSEQNVPAGTRVRIGTALLEITAEPHLGCDKFNERLGADALRWVNLRENRPRRLRGVNCRVIESGEVAVGDAVEVVR